MELKKVMVTPTTEQLEIIRKIYNYTIEVIQLDIDLFILFQISNNIPSFSCFSSDGEIIYFSEHFFYSNSITEWKMQSESIQLKVLELINS